MVWVACSKLFCDVFLTSCARGVWIFTLAAGLGFAATTSVSVASAAESGQSSGSAPVGKSGTPEARQETTTVTRLLRKSQGARVRVVVEFEISRLAGQARRPEAALNAAEASAQRFAIDQVRDWIIAGLGGTDHGNVKTYRTLPVMALEVGPEALRRLADDPEVVRIEEDVLAAPDLARSIPLVGDDIARAEGYSGDGWTIAILDTGVASNHPFLAGKVVSEACYSTNDSTARSLCPRGARESTAPGSGRNCPARIAGCEHGTHVAGIAAGRGGIASGVARDAQLISIQVFSRFSDCSDFGLSSPCVLSFFSDLLSGLERVLELSSGLDIAAVNLSLGDGIPVRRFCDDHILKGVIDDLRAVGIATVVSSGNEGRNRRINSPACISSAIAVGSTTKRDQISSFSNHAESVDLLAPGSRIRSSVPDRRFAVFYGTSMAAPHVAGAFAVLRNADPSATVDQIEAALEGTGRLLRRAGISKPRIQVDAAVEALLGSAGRRLDDDFVGASLQGGAIGASTGSNLGAPVENR